MHRLWPEPKNVSTEQLSNKTLLKLSNKNKQVSSVEIFTVLGRTELKHQTVLLEEGYVTCILGGSKIDLREADMINDAMTIDLLLVMSGIELMVPAHWQVSTQLVNVLGDLTDRTLCRAEEQLKPRKSLHITGLLIMGGITVTN